MKTSGRSFLYVSYAYGIHAVCSSIFGVGVVLLFVSIMVFADTRDKMSKDIPHALLVSNNNNTLLRGMINQFIMAKNNFPNIFSFATSELSQDAFFAWIISFADDEYLNIDQDTCVVGKRLLSLFTNIPFDEIHHTVVVKQKNHIDLLVEINDDSVLVIEDKTGTSIHDNQLIRYREIVEEEYKNKRSHLLCVYIKTENESFAIERKILSQNYMVINREQILSVLDGYKGSNNIIFDYTQHLHSIENATNRYKSLSVAEWGWYEWQGFYKEIEKSFPDSGWTYVPNQSGGFLGFWWNFRKNEEIEMHYQFEQSKLCVKIRYSNSKNKAIIREKYYNAFKEVAKEAMVNFKKPKRFGSGVYMTIGVIEDDL